MAARGEEQQVLSAEGCANKPQAQARGGTRATTDTARTSPKRKREEEREQRPAQHKRAPSASARRNASNDQHSANEPQARARGEACNNDAHPCVHCSSVFGRTLCRVADAPLNPSLALRARWVGPALLALRAGSGRPQRAPSASARRNASNDRHSTNEPQARARGEACNNDTHPCVHCSSVFGRTLCRVADAPLNPSLALRARWVDPRCSRCGLVRGVPNEPQARARGGTRATTSTARTSPKRKRGDMRARGERSIALAAPRSDAHGGALLICTKVQPAGADEPKSSQKGQAEAWIPQPADECF